MTASSPKNFVSQKLLTIWLLFRQNDFIRTIRNIAPLFKRCISPALESAGREGSGREKMFASTSEIAVEKEGKCLMTSA